MNPNKGKEAELRKRSRRIREKIKTGADHKIGKLAELDGAGPGRLSNEARGKAGNGRIGFGGSSDQRINGSKEG
jgi:hypothetical protein